MYRFPGALKDSLRQLYHVYYRKGTCFQGGTATWRRKQPTIRLQWPVCLYIFDVYVHCVTFFHLGCSWNILFN